MKKILLFVLLLQLFCVVSFAQQKAKPTKEETMDWLAGKMKQYLDESSTFRSYSAGKFIYKWTPESWDGYVVVTVDLNLVRGRVYDSTFHRGEDGFTGKRVVYLKWYDKNGKFDHDEYGDIEYFDFSSEKGLSGRVERAIDTLINYNINKNEPF